MGIATFFRMQINPDQLLAELLQLPVHVRARLAESLIASLDEDAAVERAWQAEVAHRVAALDAAEAELREAAAFYGERAAGPRRDTSQV